MRAVLFVIVAVIATLRVCDAASIRFNANNAPSPYLEYFLAMRQPDGSYREVPGAIVQATASETEAPYVTRIPIPASVPDGAQLRVHARRKFGDRALTEGSNVVVYVVAMNNPSAAVIEP